MLRDEQPTSGRMGFTRRFFMSLLFRIRSCVCVCARVWVGRFWLFAFFVLLPQLHVTSSRSASHVLFLRSVAIFASDVLPLAATVVCLSVCLRVYDARRCCECCCGCLHLLYSFPNLCAFFCYASDSIYPQILLFQLKLTDFIYSCL